MNLLQKLMLMILGIGLFLVGCNKKDERSQSNIYDITEKVGKLQATKEAMKTLIQYREKELEYLNSNLKDENKVNEYLALVKQADTKEKLVNVYNLAGIPNSDSVVDDLIFQNNKINEVYSAVPELMQLSVEDRTKLFTEIFEEQYQAEKVNRQMQNIPNFKFANKVSLEDMSCYHNFALSWESCDQAFYGTMLAIWATVLVGSTATVEVGALPLVAGGFLASGIAGLMREVCYSEAETSFGICASN